MSKPKPRPPRTRAPRARASSASAARPGRPRKWDLMVSAAYLRSLGETQKRAAEATGVSERSVRSWEHHKAWPAALAEAHGRWLQGVRERVKRGLLKALGDPSEYASMVRYAADRLIPELAPPKVRTELSGSDESSEEAPVTVRVRLVE